MFIANRSQILYTCSTIRDCSSDLRYNSWTMLVLQWYSMKTAFQTISFLPWSISLPGRHGNVYGGHGDVFECKLRPGRHLESFQRRGVQNEQVWEPRPFFCVCKYTISRGGWGHAPPGNFYILLLLVQIYAANFMHITAQYCPKLFISNVIKTKVETGALRFCTHSNLQLLSFNDPEHCPLQACFNIETLFLNCLHPRICMTGHWTINISRIFTAVPTNAHPNHILARSFLPRSNNT